MEEGPVGRQNVTEFVARKQRPGSLFLVMLRPWARNLTQTSFPHMWEEDNTLPAPLRGDAVWKLA